MRKELGKPTRELFFARLKEIAPQFEYTSRDDIKGFTWTFVRRLGDLHQAITFQRHKYDDAFTIEIAWSCVFDNPFRSSFGEPTDSFRREGRRFRLGRFWEPQKDVWWYVVDPSQTPSGLGLVDVLHPHPFDLEAARAGIRTAVDDAARRIEQFALPYLDEVARWAADGAGGTAGSNKDE